MCMTRSKGKIPLNIVIIIFKIVSKLQQICIILEIRKIPVTKFLTRNLPICQFASYNKIILPKVNVLLPKM